MTTAAKSPAKTVATRRPAAAKAPADHQPKAEPKPKVKKVDGGHEITLHGVTVTVLDSALGDFETTDDLSLLGEAFEESSTEEPDEALLQEASARVPGLMRRLVGVSGSRSVYRALRKENEGTLDFGDAVGFITDLMKALAPNA